LQTVTEFDQMSFKKRHFMSRTHRVYPEFI